MLKILAEKDVKSNGQPRPPAYNRLGNDANMQYKTILFRYLRPFDVDGIKIVDKDA